jgi:hypothetical protein
MHELAGGRAAEMHGHLQRVQDQVGAQVRGGLPADDHAREDVLDERQVEKALAGLEVGEIADPQPIRTVGDKAPLDQVGRARRRLIGDREPVPLAAGLGAAQPVGPHQPLDAAARRRHAMAPQRLPDPVRPIGTVVLLVHDPDALKQPAVLDRAP